MSPVTWRGTLARLRGAVSAAAAAALCSGPPSVAAECCDALRGRIVDASGASVAGATVTVTANDQVLTVQSGRDGAFAVEGLRSTRAGLTVAAQGFAAQSLSFDLQAGRQPLSIVLRPAPFAETVSVTATRGAARLDTPHGISILAAAELLTAAASALDDALRATPGFSLFRRSSSRTANPTTQGVTLRGLSSSGASRTLVLADGVALNDPFGGWVYWNRIPLAAVERVEVVRGASPDLHGADALGGVIQILTFAADRPRLRALVDVASHDTVRASAFGSLARSGSSASVGGEWVDTAGVPVVARLERGPVDVRADSDSRSAFATLGHAGERWHVTVRGHVYAEDRGNGTPLQSNATKWRQIAGEASGILGGGAWLARGSLGSQDYEQTFSAVSEDRTTERLTAEQVTPTSSWSAAGQWTRAWGPHALLAGVEGRGAEATNTETRFTAAGAALLPAVTGGSERIGSAFARARLGSDRLRLDLGARVESWRSQPRGDAAARSVSRFSPRVSVSLGGGRGIAFTASAYRNIRAPSLNELHRDFRVGNILTTANPALDPERLTGVDAGVLASGRVASVRLTGFLNDMDDAITNVTQSVTPALILRQRQNAGGARSRGLEMETELRLGTRAVLSAMAAVTDARLRGSAALPALEGKRVPQVPRYQAALGATLTGGHGLTLTAQARLVGRQFDDDLNQFELDSFAVVDAAATRAIGRRLSVSAAVENLFDAEYDAGRTPIRTVGWPRTLRASVRFFWP